MSGPFFLVRATAAFAAFGYRLWARLLGKRHARVFLIVGAAVSTVVAIILEAR